MQPPGRPQPSWPPPSGSRTMRPRKGATDCPGGRRPALTGRSSGPRSSTWTGRTCSAAACLPVCRIPSGWPSGMCWPPSSAAAVRLRQSGQRPGPGGGCCRSAVALRPGRGVWRNRCAAVVVLALFALLRVGGLVVGDRCRVAGRAGAAACVLWAMRNYTFLLLAVIAVGLIAFAVWRLNRGTPGAAPDAGPGVGPDPAGNPRSGDHREPSGRH